MPRSIRKDKLQTYGVDSITQFGVTGERMPGACLPEGADLSDIIVGASGAERARARAFIESQKQPNRFPIYLRGEAAPYGRKTRT